ncbi:hypothetical protein D3C86_1069730 [compost metagenome]
MSVDRFFGRCVGSAFFRTTVTVDHVVASDFLLAGTHQGQFDLVLDFFDVDGAARWHATLEGRGDLFGQAGNGVVDSRRGSSGAAFNCEERFGDGDGDFVIGVGNDSAVTLDHAQLARRGGGQIRIRISGLRQGALRVLASCVGLHGGVSPHSLCLFGHHHSAHRSVLKHYNRRGPGIPTSGQIRKGAIGRRFHAEVFGLTPGAQDRGPLR